MTVTLYSRAPLPFLAVSDSLPVSVLLGRDVPDLVNIGKTKCKFSCVGVRDVTAVTTRAQARAKRAEESQLAEREQREAAVTTEVDSNQNHPVAPKDSEETATITDQDTQDANKFLGHILRHN